MYMRLLLPKVPVSSDGVEWTEIEIRPFNDVFTPAFCFSSFVPFSGANSFSAQFADITFRSFDVTEKFESLAFWFVLKPISGHTSIQKYRKLRPCDHQKVMEGKFN